MKFRVENMTCGGCARGVTRALQKLDPGAEIAVDVEGRLVEVRTARPAEEVAQTLTQAGFPPVAA